MTPSKKFQKIFVPFLFNIKIVYVSVIKNGNATIGLLFCFHIENHVIIFKKHGSIAIIAIFQVLKEVMKFFLHYRFIVQTQGYNYQPELAL